MNGYQLLRGSADVLTDLDASTLSSRLKSLDSLSYRTREEIFCRRPNPKPNDEDKTCLSWSVGHHLVVIAVQGQVRRRCRVECSLPVRAFYKPVVIVHYRRTDTWRARGAFYNHGIFPTVLRRRREGPDLETSSAIRLIITH